MKSVPARNLTPVLTLLAAVALATTWTTTAAPPASAHTELEASNPRPGAVLTRGSARIVPTFDDPMEEQFSTVAAMVGSGPARRLETSTKGTVTTAAVPSSLANSSAATAGGTTPWRVVYRAVSADGHPVSGPVAGR